MTTIKFTTEAGESFTYEGKPGENVMQVGVKNGVPGIVGECGGELSCATCHVLVPEDKQKHFSRVSPDEDDLLESMENRQLTSRLSCQLKLTDELAELSLEVPEEC